MTKTLYVTWVLLATLDAKAFLERHGSSLSEALHVTAGNRGLDLYREADQLLDGPNPDPFRVGKTLRKMRDILAECDTPEGRNAASLRWHGARLSDLVAKLPS